MKSSEILRESMDAISSLVEAPKLGSLQGTTRDDREEMRNKKREQKQKYSQTQNYKDRIKDSGYEGISQTVFSGNGGIFAITTDELDSWLKGIDVTQLIKEVLSRKTFKSPFLKKDDPRRQVFIDVLSQNEQFKNLVTEYMDYVVEGPNPQDRSAEKSITNYQQKIKRFLLSAEKQFENRVVQSIQRR